MSSETSGRFPNQLNDFWDLAKFNYEHIIWLNQFKVFVLHFFITLPIFILFYIIKKRKAIHTEIAIFAIVWFVIELHKIPMKYLPNQYLTSTLFAVGIFIASIYSELTSYFSKFKYIILTIAIIIGLYNLKKDGGSFKRRTHQLEIVNHYLASFNLRNKTVIGAWAPSSCFECKAYTLPVWDKYFNWKDPIKIYKPTIIITEFDEKDADYTYKSQGIDLKQLSDSNRTFDVWNYKLVVYWIKQVNK